MIAYLTPYPTPIRFLSESLRNRLGIPRTRTRSNKTNYDCMHRHSVRTIRSASMHGDATRRIRLGLS